MSKTKRPETSKAPTSADERAKQLELALAVERARAKSRDLARVALTQLQIDPERALLIAQEACARAITYEARDALQQALAATRIRGIFGGAHGPRITHAIFSHDGQHIITAGEDGALRWWDVDAQQQTAALQLAAAAFDALCFSRRRERALISTHGQDEHHSVVRVIDLMRQRVVATLKDTDEMNVGAAFFSDDDRRVVIECDSDIAIWDAENGERIAQVSVDGRCLGISHDGERALVQRYDGTAALLDLQQKSEDTLLELPSDLEDSSDLNRGANHFSPDGRHVTAGRDNRLVYVWDAETGRLIHTLGFWADANAVAAEFSPSGQFIVSTTVQVWNAESGELLCTLPNINGFGAPLRYLRAAGTEREHAIVGFGSTQPSWPPVMDKVSECSITTGEIIRHFRLAAQQQEIQTTYLQSGEAVHGPGPAPKLDLSLDASRVLSLFDGVVRIYARVDAEDAPPFERYSPNHRFTARREIQTRSTADAKPAHAYSLCERASGRVIAELGSRERHVFSPDGRYLAVTGYSDRSLTLWDADSGAELWTIDPCGKPITTLLFVSDARQRELLLVGSMDRTLRLLSLDGGRAVAGTTLDAPDGAGYGAAIAPDGSGFAFASAGKIHVWRPEGGDVVSASAKLYARGLRFSADGVWLLGIDEDVIRIWDAATLQPISEFRQHFAPVVTGDLAPDRSLAASFGQDRCVRLWEPLSGLEITQWRFPRHQERTTDVLSFSSNGTRLTLDREPPMIVPMAELLALARAWSTRELSPDERSQFIDQRTVVDAA